MEIHWTHTGEIRDAEREATERRLASLAADQTDLIDVRITAKPNRHHRHGGQEVRIVCQARGREIVAARSRPDLELALHDALQAFEGEVRRLRSRRETRRVERVPGPAHLGVIDRVFPDEGYGFILTEEGERVYFHRNAVNSSLTFEGLSEGERVGLNLEAGRKGLQATTVTAPPVGTPA